MAKKKLTQEEYKRRKAELSVLFAECDHDDDRVLDIISDDDGEVDDDDFWIVRMLLAEWQIGNH